MRVPIGECVEPTLLLAAVIAVTIAAVAHAIAEYVVVVVAALLILSFVHLQSEPVPPAPELQPQLRLSTTDLANGAIIARPQDYLTLEVDPGDPGGRRTYPNLQLRDVYDKDGHSIAFTSDPPSAVLLSVDSAMYDEVVDWVKGKKASLSLRPQSGFLTPTPTPAAPLAPSPTALPSLTPAPGAAIFVVPTAKIQSVLEGLETDSEVQAILVFESKDANGRVQSDSHRFKARLLDIVDARGARVEAPYQRAVQVRLSLPRRTDVELSDVELFAREAASATAIYVLPGY